MAALAFTGAFAMMEFTAWWLHKYVMHGPLWSLHQDHHLPSNRRFQKNDSFAIVFAVPSFLMILAGGQFTISWLAAAGYGVLAYGVAYFLVHEAIIHRRFRFIRGRGRYFLGVIAAHRDHHRSVARDGAVNFAMLAVPIRYFRERRRASGSAGVSTKARLDIRDARDGSRNDNTSRATATAERTRT